MTKIDLLRCEPRTIDASHKPSTRETPQDRAPTWQKLEKFLHRCAPPLLMLLPLLGSVLLIALGPSNLDVTSGSLLALSGSTAGYYTVLTIVLRLILKR